jgi:hypothetical protein
MNSLSDQVKADQIEFLREMDRRCVRAAEFLRSALRDVLDTQGSPTHHAPPGDPPLKQSGRLLESIKVRIEGNGFEVYTDCPYAPIVDKKHPFWGVTIAACEPKIRHIIFGD